jgi:hypothetical protein
MHQYALIVHSGQPTTRVEAYRSFTTLCVATPFAASSRTK